MSGGSYAHFQIIGNLPGELHGALKKRPCSVGSSDLRLRVSLAGLYTYPDVIVICGEPKFADDQKDTLLNPTLIARSEEHTSELQSHLTLVFRLLLEKKKKNLFSPCP